MHDIVMIPASMAYVCTIVNNNKSILHIHTYIHTFLCYCIFKILYMIFISVDPQPASILVTLHNGRYRLRAHTYKNHVQDLKYAMPKKNMFKILLKEN